MARPGRGRKTWGSLAAIAAWRAGERVVARLGRRWVEQGRRDSALPLVTTAAGAATGLLAMLAVLAIAGMALWSMATQWRFPDALPSGFTMSHWVRLTSGLAGPAAATLAIGVTATLIALVLAVACLEHEADLPRRGRAPALSLLYLPLLVPQVAFLFGLQVLLVHAGWDGTFAAVVWAHLVFVLPYLFLLKIDGRTVEGSADLSRTIRAVRPGQKITLTVWRAGKVRDLVITVGEFKDDEAKGPAGSRRRMR